MASIAEIMQLCRLCLVKEQVNVPIFEEQGDIRQIFLKITACLPVKISREDNLPKKICNGCLYKLELLYQFWNTSTNAEKQLLSWLTAAGLDATTQTTQDAMAVVTQTQVVLKQEPNPEITENVTVVSDPGNFILQATQQPIEFPAVDFDYQDNFTAEQELANNAISADVDDSTESEPVAKRPRRTATATVTAPLIESEDDADDPGEAAVAAKTEEDSDDDTNVEPTFVDVAEDQDGEQPGPSGLGKIVEPSLNQACVPNVIFNEKEDERKRKKSLYSHRDNHKIIIKNRPVEEVYINKRYTPIKTSFKCRRCGLELASRSEMCHHNKVHKNEIKKKEFKCRDCTVVLPTKKKLVAHRIEMHPQGVRKELRVMYIANEEATEFTCNTCKKSFYKREEVEAHVTVHMKRYPCPDCDQVFLRLKQFALHSRHHSKEDMYHCGECGHKCKGYPPMVTHINRIHLNLYTVECPQCDKRFMSTGAFKIHFEQHHTTLKFKCIVCEQIFHAEGALLRHQREVHFVSSGNSVDCCPICNKRYTNRKTLKAHIASHNPKHLCNVCGKSFILDSLLKTHIRVHTGEKPFKCSYCEKSFRASDRLRVHERIHTGEEPYTCEHCGKGFKQVQPLKIHRRIHTGERPYKCIMCQKGFISNTVLKNHQKSCSNKYND